MYNMQEKLCRLGSCCLRNRRLTATVRALLAERMITVYNALFRPCASTAQHSTAQHSTAQHSTAADGVSAGHMCHKLHCPMIINNNSQVMHNVQILDAAHLG